MTTKTTYLLYNREHLEARIPDHWNVLAPVDPPACDNLDHAINQALTAPTGTAPLKQIAQAKPHSSHAVIVVSDITRAVPNPLFLPAIIDTLLKAGYSRSAIVILIATGMHRPSTDAERAELLGSEIAKTYRVIDHRADAADTLVKLPGATSSGTEVRVDRVYHDAELRILTGFIEPHFMAGFSGGRKSICPGLVDLATLQKFHGPQFLSSPNAAMGVLDGNPCHREALDVARMVRPDVIFNVTIDAEGRITGIFAGELEQAHEAGMDFVRQHMTVTIDEPFELIFTSAGGYPLDATFYQAVKGMVAASDFLAPGGTIVIAGACTEQLGSDQYKKLMFEYADDTNYERFLADIFSRDDVLRDQWELQMQARVLAKTSRSGLIMITDGIAPDDLRKCNVTAAQDIVEPGTPTEMLERLIAHFNAQRVAFIPRGPYILPRMTH